MKKDRLFNLIMILLLAGLAFLLYQMTGGDWTVWLKAGQAGQPADSFLSGLTDGMRSVSDSIGNVFSRLMP